MLYIFEEPDKLDDGFLETAIPLLSSQRYEKVQKLPSAAVKKASCVSYLLLRLALLNVYKINEAVIFKYCGNGKPLLADHPQIHFNLSHSKNAVACIVADAPVGVDVQHITAVKDKVAKRVLTEKEYEGFILSPVPDRYFCEIWTIKESFLKKTGQGITIDLRQLEAEKIPDKNIYENVNYFCCVCGSVTNKKYIKEHDFFEL